MTPELLVLTLAGLLQAVQLGLFAVPANLELGPAKTMSPRDPQRMDQPMEKQVSTRTGRLARAYNNHTEALLLFAVAVVVTTVSGQSSWVTGLLAWIYLGARILYIPAYAFGWVPGRSIIFGVGWIATILMLLAALI